MNPQIYIGLEKRIQVKYSLKKESNFISDIQGFYSIPTTTADIISFVSKVMDVSFEDMASKSRKRNLVFARFIAMSLIRHKIGLNFKTIGILFNKDHSSVMYCVDMASSMFEFDVRFRNLYKSVHQQL